MKLKNKNRWTALLFVLVTFFYSSEAYPLSQGNIGSELWGWELDATEPWPDTLLPGTEADLYNASGPVSYNYPLPYSPVPLWTTGYGTESEISGYADAGNMDLGAYANAQSWRTATIKTEMGNSFMVTAGSSGLGLGDATTVTFNISLDGSLNVHGNRNLSNYSSWVDVSSRFRVWDPTIEICGEGCSPAYLINFETSMNYQESSNFGDIYNAYQWNWDVDTWSGAGYDTPYSDFGNEWWELEYNQFSTCYTAPGGDEASCSGESFDTGMLSITIDTYIGAELFYYGRLNILSQARGDSTLARGDFLNTFGGSATADDEGVLLSYLIPPTTEGSTEVPEPATILLLGSGLIGLAFFRRKTELA